MREVSVGCNLACTGHSYRQGIKSSGHERLPLDQRGPAAKLVGLAYDEVAFAVLTDSVYFLAIARHGSFRQAATELGVTPSVLSHAIAGLEARQGVRLLNRTMRRVTLYRRRRGIAGQHRGAARRDWQGGREPQSRPGNPDRGVRINVLEDAVPLLLDPALPKFVERYPDVHVDLCFSKRIADVITGGFDAGIRYGGIVPENMIAWRLSPDIRWIAAASPNYIAGCGMPEHARDLADHRCIGIRFGIGEMYRWEFERGTDVRSRRLGRSRSMPVQRT